MNLPTADQYRTLGDVLIGHGFRAYGEDLQDNAELLARWADATPDITSEVLAEKIEVARHDRNAAARLCRIFDVLNAMVGGKPL